MEACGPTEQFIEPGDRMALENPSDRLAEGNCPLRSKGPTAALYCDPGIVMSQAILHTFSGLLNLPEPMLTQIYVAKWRH